MADKTITDLDFAPGSVNDSNTFFAVMQNGAAYKLTGSAFYTAMAVMYNAHGAIASIEKTGTSGLVDTYTITFADHATTTFTVTNGNGITGITQYFARSSSGTTVPTSGWSTTRQTLTSTYKYLWSYFVFTKNSGTVETPKAVIGAYGDTGSAAHVYIRYASNCTGNPPAPSSMGTQADAWMGIYAGTASSAPTTPSSYTWYKIKGDSGNKGDPATLSSQSTTYQIGESGSVAPTGVWSNTVPASQPGKYLWTRVILTFNTGSPVTFYSVSHYGLDGSGAVSTVNNLSPDSGGNIDLTASNIPTSDSQTTQKHLDDIEGKIGTTTLPTTSQTLSGAISEHNSQIQSLLRKEGNSSFLTVGATNCDFTTIGAAITKAKQIIQTSGKHVTILLAPQTYDEQITLNPNPGISFIGYGATIRSNSTYPDAPLYSVGGKDIYYVGITFINNNASGNAYAIHAEAQNVSGIETGNTYFVNCVFYSAGNAAFGLGLGANLYYYFTNCFFTSSKESTAGLYMHNYPAGSSSSMGATFDGCHFIGAGVDVTIDDAAHMGRSNTSPLIMTFRNCTGANHKVSVRVGTSEAYTSIAEAIQHDTNLSLTDNSVGNISIPGLDKNYGYFTLCFSAPVINNRVFIPTPQYPYYYGWTVQAVHTSGTYSGYTFNWFNVSPYIEFANPQNMASAEIWILAKPF